jgi:hypothetical protein
MRERALLVGGKFEIDSRPGKGTTVRLEVPIQEQPADDKDEATGELHAASASGIGSN